MNIVLKDVRVSFPPVYEPKGMIRTREDLLHAMSGGKRLYWYTNGRMSDPVRFMVETRVVHGGAVTAAIRRDEIVNCGGDGWSHGFYSRRTK